jgi:hypothetical protein
MLLHHTNLLSQSFRYFYPTIVNSQGYGSIETLLLTVPPWFTVLALAPIVAYHSSCRQERYFHIIGCMSIAYIGFIIVVSATGAGPRMLAMFLMPLGTVPAFQINLSWIASTFARP